MEHEKPKCMRFQGLSFLEELQGVSVGFDTSPVYLSVVPWETCNWRCSYCHQDGRPQQTLLEQKHILGLIEQAPSLGIRSVLFLGGEVLREACIDRTREIVKRTFELKLIPVLYTNAYELTEDVAFFLADHNASIAIKLDSLDREKYDRLAGKAGGFEATLRAIELLKRTTIGKLVFESDTERLVRLLFSTVGCSMNLEEYVSLARFATRHGARWMMETLNQRGGAAKNHWLAVDARSHSEAMRLAISLNPEQKNDFARPCRLLSGITIRHDGRIALCPQDYNFVGSIHEVGDLRGAWELLQARSNRISFRQNWNGICPVKQKNFNTRL